MIDDQDPLAPGRLLISAPEILGDAALNWVMPCAPDEPPRAGAPAMPTIGTAIWGEFEGGDLNYPIWTGRYWREGDLPEVAPPE